MEQHGPLCTMDEPMSEAPQQAAVTRILARASEGDAAATEELFPIVYEELRGIAAAFLKDERRAQTMQPTALVNEAYLRLIGPGETTWENRGHFFGAAARAIRRILTDHARHRNRARRGGGLDRVPLHEDAVASDPSSVDFEALDAALSRLSEMDPQKGHIVELRFFGGLTVEHAALVLGISPSTVAREWQFARVWLGRELGADQ